MAGGARRMNNYDATTVKASIDIVKVVEEYVRLRRVGATSRYLGLCPFHQEKTPSFNVNQAKQFYKCFGCDAGGDVITFTMQIAGLGFPQAVNSLGERFGVEPTESWTPEKRRQYAHAAAGANELAQKLSDFASGLKIAADRSLTRLTPILMELGIDPAETLRHLHRGAHILDQAKPVDIGRTWRTERLKDPWAVAVIERLGRRDWEHAEVLHSDDR